MLFTHKCIQIIYLAICSYDCLFFSIGKDALGWQCIVIMIPSIYVHVLRQEINIYMSFDILYM